jgi:hypothetical protein
MENGRNVNMHSRIIELSQEPIKVDDRICESDYYDNGFISSIADYVTSCDRTDAINWVCGYLKNKDVVTEFDTNKIVFSENVKEKFFKDSFEEFNKLTNKITFEDFVGKDDFKLYLIKQSIEDTSGFYIHYDGCYWTLDYFIRRCVEDNEIWYIGGALDYHF